MKKFEGMLFCTDLDGTLLNSRREISPENMAAIEYFKSEGGYFTFITGRMPYYARDIYNVVKPNAPVGCINGGGIYDYTAEKYLWAQTLAPDVLELVDYVHGHIEGMGSQVNTLEKLYFYAENAAMEVFRRETGVPDLAWDPSYIDLPIAKIIFGDGDMDHMDRLTRLLQEHPRAGEFGFVRSEKWLYEIVPYGISKANALKRLAPMLNVDMARTIAIGDYNNDTEIIRAAGLGVAVENAVPEVKAAADLVTVHHDSHAIATIISALDSGEIEI